MIPISFSKRMLLSTSFSVLYAGMTGVRTMICSFFRAQSNIEDYAGLFHYFSGVLLVYGIINVFDIDDIRIDNRY